MASDVKINLMDALNTVKRQKIIAGVIILILLWTGNLLYYFEHELDHPLFMNHHYELYLDESWQDYSLDLYYLVNRLEDQEIRHFRLLGTDRNLEVENYPIYIFNHQTLKRLHVALTQDDIKALLNSGGEFKQAEVLFSNGERNVLDLGLIRFSNAETVNQAIEEQDYGNTYDDTGYHIFKVQEPIEITDIDFSLKEELAARRSIYIDTSQMPAPAHLSLDDPNERFRNPLLFYSFTGSALSDIEFPLSLESGDYLKIVYQLQPSSEQTGYVQESFILQKDTYYRLLGKIYYLTQEQEHNYKEFYIIYAPQLTKEDIRWIVETRRGE